MPVTRTGVLPPVAGFIEKKSSLSFSSKPATSKGVLTPFPPSVVCPSTNNLDCTMGGMRWGGGGGGGGGGGRGGGLADRGLGGGGGKTTATVPLSVGVS